MRRFSRLALSASLLALALPWFSSSGLAINAPAWPQDGSDLKPDPAAFFGSLPNGLRYVILPNAEPKNRVSLRLLVASGSLEETEGQRGLAHYLEHMAFNGSMNYAPGTLVEYFQRLGMSFGGDTNAYTTFDHTAFQIELPEASPVMLKEGLRVFSDFAGRLLLLDSQVDKERGIILSEKRARDSVQYRTDVAEYEFLLGDSLFPKRMPIGLSEVIGQAKRDRFVDFYNDWYRPERMTVIVVGQVDAFTVAGLIKEAFGDIAPRAPAQPDPNLGSIPAVSGLIARMHPEPEAPATAVSIETMVPVVPEPDSTEKRLKYLPRDLAFRILNRRLETLAKKEGSPFSHGAAGIDEEADFYRNATLELLCKPEQWTAALTTAEHELRRALTFGFQSVELTEAVQGYRNELEEAVHTAPTRLSKELANDLIGSVMHKVVFTSPESDLALLGPALDKVSVDDCLAALQAVWKPDHRYLFVAGNVSEEDSGPNPAAASARIIKVYEKAQAADVAAPDKIDEAPFAYTDFGGKGLVVSRTHVDDLNLDEVRFANGVRLNLKHTDFEKASIAVSVRLGGGRLTEPASQPALGFITNYLFTPGGLGKHSIDDLQRLFASKTVSINFSTRDDAFQLSGATNQQDLDTQLQLLAAYLTDPGFRPEAMRQARKEIDQLYTRFAHTPEGIMQTVVPNLLANGDPRFGLPGPDVTLSRTQDEVKGWINPVLAHGPIEIAVVGDIDVDATIDAVARTFGALPNREDKPPYTEERKVSFPAEPFARTFTVDSQIPKGVVAVYWPTTDSRDVHRSRRLHLLAEILSDRLRVKIREQLGDTYSPVALSAPSDTYTDYGFMLAHCIVDPAKASTISRLILAIADDLQQNGVTADELNRAKQPVLTALKEDARTNGYWISSVLGSVQEFPERLDWARSRFSDVESITKPELDELAKTYLASSRASKVIVLPSSTGS